jgi:glycosyltransferase involved in cell wall biosynthesis
MIKIKNYLLLNPQLKNLSINEIKKEYYKDIIDDNKITTIDDFFKKYKSFDIEFCRKFNPNIEKLSLIEILGYVNFNNNNIIYSKESFFKKYPEFNINIIRKIIEIINKSYDYNDLDIMFLYNKNSQYYNNKLNNLINLFYIKNPLFNIKDFIFFYDINNDCEKTIILDIINKKYKNLIYSEDTFYTFFPDFNIELYKNKYNINYNFKIMKLWYNENKFNFVSFNYRNNSIMSSNEILEDIVNNDDSIMSSNEILEDIVNNDDSIMSSNEEINKEYIKLAHIFVHFFKIGGGESYLSKFSYYNNIFDETIFINKNYNHETLFNYKSKIVYYNDYVDLNNKIKEYDIIIDHQLYWFELENTLKTFVSISPNKIIRIIHGVPIHYLDISKYNFYYTIELYKDLNSHVSWNNHIKIYNNIGVKKNNKKIIFDENNKKIAIVGRINPDKIPNIFLKLLIKFTACFNNYQFNFYGDIDENYKKSFFISINNKNIIYHGIIDPSNIQSIYLENNILLHPSKMEAGATVVLEAMSYGLPIICRNTYGLKNAVGDNNYLCNNEEEMFTSLIEINNKNYYDISKNNILKILNENSEKNLFTKLVKEIKLIYDCEKVKDKIPNIIHYVFGLRKQVEEFSFVYYLSILSNYIINKPLIIYFHYQYLPYGYWWDKTLCYVKLNYINTNNIYWGKKKIIKYAHKADKIRLDILYKYGGIYMDIDTITYKSYQELLNYDFAIGIQEENYGKDKITLYCNAILFSKKNNIFIKKWIEEYENYFNPDGWCEASVHLPGIVLNNLNNNDKEKIKILDKEYFYIPSYNEVDKIFKTEGIINKNLLTLHLWNTYSEKYYKNILNFDWCFTNNSLYSLLIKNILKILDKDGNNIKDKNKIYNISIITIFKENLNYKNLLYSLVNQKNFYQLNLQLIILDNTSLFNKIYDEDSELKNLFISKNFEIKIIELEEELNLYNAFNIGITYSKNELISFFNIDDIIIDNGILLKCIEYENIIRSSIKYKILCSTNYQDINSLNNNLINVIRNKIEFNINNIIFNKKYIKFYFINKNVNLFIFLMINSIDEKHIYFNNNIINNNIDNKLFNSIFNYEDLVCDQIKYNYLDYIKEIYNY